MTKEQINEMRELREKGMTYKKISEYMNVPITTVSANGKKNGLSVIKAKSKVRQKSERTKEIEKAILEYRLKGYSLTRISKELCLSRGYISTICKSLGVGGVIVENDIEKHVKETIEKWDFEYIGGYYDHNKPVKVLCKTCGNVVSIGYYCFVKNGKTYGKNSATGKPKCPKCIEIKKEIKKENEKKRIAYKELMNVLSDRYKNLKLEENKAKLEEKNNRVCTCANCGEQYTIASVASGATFTYCSIKCRNRYAERKSRDKRIKRIKSKHYDSDITLEKVYIKYGGVCYICGKQCDKNDSKWIGKTFIIGKNYPTIEHKIPISKGGAHEWNNINLACLSCNAKKGASIRPLSKK